MPTLHFRCVAWNPFTATYAPLPDGTRVRSLRKPLGLLEIIGEDTVKAGLVALSVDPDEIRLSASLPAANAFPGRVVPDPWHAPVGHRRPRGDEGTAERPYEVRFGRDVFLSFSWWNEAKGQFAPAPAGLRVMAWDDNLLVDTPIAVGQTDDKGRVTLMLNIDGTDTPDLYLTVDPPDEPLGGYPLARRWDSRSANSADRGAAHGYWPKWAEQRVGQPEAPCVQTLDESGPQLHRGNDVQLLVDGPAVLAAWEAAIASARSTIHFEVMLYFNDSMTRRVQDALLAKAREGVRVRLLLGADVTRGLPDLVRAEQLWTQFFRRMAEAERQAELEVIRVALAEAKERAAIDALMAELGAAPNLTVIDNSLGKVEVLPGIKEAMAKEYKELATRLPIFTVARVDHRKLLIIDGKLAVIGGQNVGYEYVYDKPFDPHTPDDAEEWVKWHDVSVRLDGPVVGDLQRYFRERWVTEGGDPFPLGPAEPGAEPDPAHPTFPTMAPRGDKAVRVVDTTPGARRNYHATILRLFRGAQREILISNPYFSSAEVLGALTGAAKRGVKVTFLLPDQRNDSLDFLYAARLWYPEMIRAGIEVYEYMNHMTHAKVAVVDDVGIVGTANLNHSSLFHHYELAAIVEDAGFANEMRARIWGHDLAISRRIREEDVPELLDINSAAELYLRTIVHQRF